MGSRERSCGSCGSCRYIFNAWLLLTWPAAIAMDPCAPRKGHHNTHPHPNHNLLPLGLPKVLQCRPGPGYAWWHAFTQAHVSSLVTASGFPLYPLGLHTNCTLKLYHLRENYRPQPPPHPPPSPKPLQFSITSKHGSWSHVLEQAITTPPPAVTSSYFLEEPCTAKERCWQQFRVWLWPYLISLCVFFFLEHMEHSENTGTCTAIHVARTRQMRNTC